MEDFDQMATIDMGKIEWSNINSDNEKYHAVAITNMVINHNRYFPSTSVEQTHSLELLTKILHVY